MKIMLRCCVLLTAILLLPGCGQKAATAPATGAPRVANTGAAPTQAECEELGKKLEKALREDDQAFTNSFFRFTELIQRAFSDIDMPAKDREQFNQRLPASIGPAMQRYHEQLKQAKIKYLRVKMVDGQPRIVIRLILGGDGEGVNYHEYPIVRYPDGKLGAEDMYIVSTGETITTTMRRILVPMLTQANQGLLDRLSGGEQLYAKNMQAIIAMTSNLRQGNHQAVLAAYDKLPAELQKDKSLLLITIQCAMVNEQRYAQLLELYRNQFPNDSAIDLISVDYFIMKQKYDEALQSLDRSIKTIGDDAYLHVLKGNVYMEAKQYAKAKEEIDIALKMEKDLQDAYWTRITIGLKEKNNADTLTWLKKIVEDFNESLDFDTMIKNEVYADFGKTKEFGELKKWFASRPKKQE